MDGTKWLKTKEHRADHLLNFRLLHSNCLLMQSVVASPSQTQLTRPTLTARRVLRTTQRERRAA